MIEEAIKKVSNEIAKIKAPYGEVLGTYIITKLLNTEENAKKVMDEKKTLEGCLNSVKGSAKKSAVNGMAMVDENTVYGWIREYYGINEQKATEQTAPAPAENGRKIVSLFDMI